MHPRFLLPSNVLWLVRSVLPVPDPSSRRRMICPRSHRPSSTSAPCPWNRLRHPSPTLRFKAPMRYATPSPRRIHALACLGPSRPALAHTSGRWRPPALAARSAMPALASLTTPAPTNGTPSLPLPLPGNSPPRVLLYATHFQSGPSPSPPAQCHPTGLLYIAARFEPGTAVLLPNIRHLPNIRLILGICLILGIRLI